ncbi:MAG: hypothetical protein KBD14_01595 [Candidatus Pacebacteria bacterium]|nr:hypothetical protein [Candidatus Paceibacterota bacterium]
MQITKEAFERKISKKVCKVLCGPKGYDSTILLLLVRDFLENQDSRKLNALKSLEKFLNSRIKVLSETDREFVASELESGFFAEVKDETYVLVFDEAFSRWKVELI